MKINLIFLIQDYAKYFSVILLFNIYIYINKSYSSQNAFFFFFFFPMLFDEFGLSGITGQQSHIFVQQWSKAYKTMPESPESLLKGDLL